MTCANLGVFHTKCKKKKKKKKKTKKKKRDLQETMRNKTKKRGRYGANTVSHISAKILQFVLKLNKEVSRTNQFSENKKLYSRKSCMPYMKYALSLGQIIYVCLRLPNHPCLLKSFYLKI